MDVKQQIISVLERTKTEIINNIDSQNIKASGKTQQSLHVEDRGSKIVLVEDGSGAPFETLQFGRPSGKVPFGFNAIIQQWIVDKKIQVEPIQYIRKPSEKWQPKYTPQIRGLMARAGMIAHSIKEKGTKRSKSPNLNVYTQPIDKAVEEIAGIIGSMIMIDVNVRL